MSYLEYEIDPADMEDQLRERSENIDVALDAAYEKGHEEASLEQDRDACAAFWFEQPKLRVAFCDGWDNALAGVR